MDTTHRPVVAHNAVIPPWDQLTTAQRFRYAGNLDPWAGPVDPVAAQRAADRLPQAHRNPDPCGCYGSDCAECGPLLADGQRPPKGHAGRRALRLAADLQTVAR